MDYTTRWTALQQHTLNPNPNPNSFADPYIKMFHAQQVSYPSFTPYYSHQSHTSNPNPNPNPNLTFPQPLLTSALTSQPVLHPPGIDPYANPSSYPSIHAGFEGQTPYYQDPNAVPQSWLVNEAGPVRYPADIKSLSEKSIVCTSSNSLWNNNWMTQPLANDVTESTPKNTKVIQPMRCEVCNIACNSKDVFEKHILGKKHKRNWKMQNAPTTTIPKTSLQMQNAPTTTIPKTSWPTENGSWSGNTGTIGGQMILGASVVAVGEDLETKRRKLLESGAAVDSVRICTICNIACNSQVVFDKHLAGKKHAAQAGIRPPTGTGPFVAANLKPISWINPEVHPRGNGKWKKGPKKPTIIQSTWCEVCKINCTSNDVFSKHKLGKKHQKNLEKLEKLKTDTSAPASTAAPATTNPITGQMENTEANKRKTIDSQKSGKKAARSRAPEMKKRKIKEEGAVGGAARACALCNVMCNSETVFIFHLAGQKHAAMLKKQAEAGMATAECKVVAAA